MVQAMRRLLQSRLSARWGRSCCGSGAAACSECPGSTLGASSSSSSSKEPVLNDPRAVFGGLSKSIHRGFKFDRIMKSDGLDPENVMELDQMALMSLKTQDVP